MILLFSVAPPVKNSATHLTMVTVEFLGALVACYFKC